MTRDRTLDLVKAVAIFLVLVIHTKVYLIGDYRDAGLIYGALSMCAVPLFMMTSGALLYRKPVTIFKALKGTLKMAVALGVLIVLYKVWDGSRQGMTDFNSMMGLAEKFHLYYLYLAIAIYITSPLCARLACSLTRREYFFGIVIFIATTGGIPFWKTLGYVENPFILTYALPMSYMAIGYAFIGQYIYKYRDDLPRWFSIIGFFAIYHLIKNVLRSPTEDVIYLYYDVVNPFAMIYSVSVFHFLVKSKTTTDLGLVGRHTLFIFGIHIIILEYFLSLGLTPEAFKDFQVLYPIIMSLLIIVLLILPAYVLEQIKQKL
ncbi:acyltransferase family protein [Peptoniphilus equinus]|uniref:Acyltransferase family protein n=1 Tax=Peptoniphilus equinus TaxID=3016343 RepID=A0ABY7QUK6_9FIRM|nr:acyltransferase family protein [Peptoniphilus equinus]WBW50465.1 acyltransferase family protein [Peptoniphilus equinus]